MNFRNKPRPARVAARRARRSNQSGAFLFRFIRFPIQPRCAADSPLLVQTRLACYVYKQSQSVQFNDGNSRMATALATLKPRRKEVPKDKILCEYCTAKCC